jgi:hypothetical protein
LINTWDTNRIRLDVSKDLNVLNTIFQASQNYKPFPQFGSVNLISNYGHNTYHAGTVRVEKRYSGGLILNAFYTFQKTLTDNEGEGGVGGVDYYNRRLEKGLASFLDEMAKAKEMPDAVRAFQRGHRRSCRSRVPTSADLRRSVPPPRHARSVLSPAARPRYSPAVRGSYAADPRRRIST